MIDAANHPERLMLSRASILRIVLDLIAAEIARARSRSPLVLGAALWNEATRLDDRGIDLDSLERLGASAALSEYSTCTNMARRIISSAFQRSATGAISSCNPWHRMESI